MSEMSARWRDSWIIALKVGGTSGVVLALITDFFYSLAPISMWLFLIALTILTVTGMVAALQPVSPPIAERGLWFAPFGLTLLVLFLILTANFIASESATGDMGYLASVMPGVDTLQSAMGMSNSR